MASPAGDWANLSQLEQQIYETMARRLLMQFFPPCEVDKTTIEVESAGERLVARGRIIRKPGWRIVMSGEEASEGQDGGDKSAAEPLPNVQEGQSVQTREVKLGSHVTKPPPRFTQGTLLKAMKHVAKLVTDPAERKQLKAVEGIGRSATRAAIIQTLFKRNFLLPYPTPKGKQIVSSEVARILVQSIPKPLTDPGLTARWETALDAVANGRAPLAAFMQKQEQWVQHLVTVAQQTTLPKLPASPPPSFGGGGAKGGASSKSGGKSAGGKSAAKSAPKVASGPRVAAAAVGEGATCPVCKKGTMRSRTAKASGKTFFGCSNWPACNHTEWPK